MSRRPTKFLRNLLSEGTWGLGLTGTETAQSKRSGHPDLRKSQPQTCVSVHGKRRMTQREEPTAQKAELRVRELLLDFETNTKNLPASSWMDFRIVMDQRYLYGEDSL